MHNIHKKNNKLRKITKKEASQRDLPTKNLENSLMLKKKYKTDFIATFLKVKKNSIRLIKKKLRTKENLDLQKRGKNSQIRPQDP